MARKTVRDIEKIWANVEGVKKMSDRAVGVGPFGIGLDGLLTWIPVVGLTYTVGAGAWLIVQAINARATPATLAKMAGYLGVDAATSEIPVVGDAVDFFFPGHLMAAKTLQAEMEATHWVEDTEENARASGDHDRHLETVRGDKRLKRVVYLHD